MNRKKYESLCDKRRDQLIGFWTFVAVNGISLLMYALLMWGPFIPLSGIPYVFFQAVPWLVNLLFIVLALVFRPQIVMGYLASLGYWAGASLLYIPSCMAACSVLEAESAADSFLLYFTIFYLVLWFALAAWISYRLYDRACSPKS